MANNMVKVLGALIVSGVFMAATTQGCGGGSSSGTSPADACKKICEKQDSCGTLDPLTLDQCKGFCANIGASGAAGASGSGNTCGNLTPAQASAKFDACIAMSCATYEDCIENICPSGTTGGAGSGAGTAGTGGAGRGATGTAGTGATGAAGTGFPGFDGGIPGIDASAGTTCATACAKADSCCTALGAAAGQDCTFKADCDGTPAAQQSSYASACNVYIQFAPTLAGGTAPAACK